MKKQLLIFALCCSLPAQLCAQYFAPVGAVWHYDQVQIGFPQTFDYVRFEVVDDTLIEGFASQKLEVNRFQINPWTGDTLIDSWRLFLRYDSNRVHRYFPEDSAFALLYDFDAEVGDTILHYGMDPIDSVEVSIVDSIDVEVINGVPLRVQYMRYPEDLDYPQVALSWKIYERIGSIGFMLPSSTLADPPYGGPLRCYEDSILGLYQHQTFVDCDFITATAEIQPHETQIEVFPNPSTGLVALELPAAPAEVQLFQTTGSLVWSKQISWVGSSKHELDLSHLPAGLYLLHVKQGSVTTSQRLLIQR